MLILYRMTKRSTGLFPSAMYPSAMLPVTMARLAFASWETIMRRSMMMADGTCSPAEYRRMTEEKTTAMMQSMTAAMSGQGADAVVAPFVVKARANAKRLRRNG